MPVTRILILRNSLNCASNLKFSETQNLNEDGIVSIGTFVKSGDILVGKIIEKDDSEQLPEAKLLRAIFGAKSKGVRDSSFRMPNGEYGRVLRIIIFRQKNKLVSEFEKIQNIEEGVDINLWFEDDLFCQVNFWFVISLLSSLNHKNSIFCLFI